MDLHELNRRMEQLQETVLKIDKQAQHQWLVNQGEISILWLTMCNGIQVAIPDDPGLMASVRQMVVQREKRAEEIAAGCEKFDDPALQDLATTLRAFIKELNNVKS